MAFLTNRRLVLIHRLLDDTLPPKFDGIYLERIVAIDATPLGLIFRLADSKEFRLAMDRPAFESATGTGTQRGPAAVVAGS